VVSATKRSQELCKG